MGEEKPLDAKSMRLELKVPYDTRFRPVLAGICERMAAHLGFTGAEATELAETIAHTTDGVLDHDEAPDYTSLDVTFATNDAEIEIRVRYLCEGENSHATDRPGIERLLSRRRNDEAPLDLIQRVMRCVEFGRDNGVEFCTLSKRLPEE